jgi:outer membrane protein insertion porin family
VVGVRYILPIVPILFLCLVPTLETQEIAPNTLFDGQPVNAVELVARPTLDAESFKHLVSQQAGQPYSSDKIRESVEALKASGQFTDVEASVLPEQGGLRLKFIMEPAFYIGVLEFPGAGAFSYSQLLGVVRYRPGEVYEKNQVEEAVPALEQFMAQGGYFAAKIQPETQLDEVHQLVAVRYRVTLGKKARFGKIQIVGPPLDVAQRLQSSLHSLRARLHGANLKEGKRYDNERLRSAQRFLRDYLGRENYLSSDVRLRPQYDPNTNRADLDFDITLGPTVVVRATGARVPKKTLHSQVPIYEENAVDQELVDIGARNITSYFQSKGYFEARVTPKMDTKASETTLTYIIERDGRHHVADVTVMGNHEIDQAALKDQILVKKSHFLSRGTFSEVLLRKTEANLDSYWHNAGYLDAKTTSRVVDRGSNIQVTFEINEGARTIVDSFRTEGEVSQDITALSDGALLVKPGQPYSPSRVTQDKNRILASYLNLGYPNATLRAEATSVSQDRHRVAVTYMIDEGPRVRVAEVVYTGQQHSRVDLIERAVNIKPESYLSENKLLEGESNLYNLGVFDWANVSPRRAISHQTDEDVIVRVHESKRNALTYGVGFESTPRSGSLSTGVLILPGLPTVGLPRNFTIIEKTIISPLGSISYSRLNLRGRAETLSVSALVSSLDQKGALSYGDPQFLDTNWKSLINTSAERNTQNPLFAARIGQAQFQIERSLDAAKTQRLQLRYTFEQTSLNHLLIQNFVPAEDLSTHMSTVSASFLRDTRDKPLDAHKGIYQSLDFQFSPKVLGSTDNVARFFGQASYYKEVRPWLVWANNVRLGLISSFSGSHVPFAKRFFSGGADSLRGFPLNGAGPQASALLCTAENDPATCTAKISVPTGGRQLFVFNSEARFPIPIKKGLGGVIFYDGGNVYQAISFHALIQSYSNSIGVGLRYQTPIGPVRIDLGRNLNPVPGLSSTQVFVTLGQSF